MIALCFAAVYSTMQHPKELSDDDIVTPYGEYDIIQDMEPLVRVKLDNTFNHLVCITLSIDRTQERVDTTHILGTIWVHIPCMGVWP